MNTVEYQNSVQSETPQQAPASVSVFVFDLPPAPIGESLSRQERLMRWLEDNPQYSNYTLLESELAEGEIDGVRTVQYQTAGLYMQDVRVAVYQGRIFLLTGQSTSPDDPLRTMYTNFIDSIRFD